MFQSKIPLFHWMDGNPFWLDFEYDMIDKKDGLVKGNIFCPVHLLIAFYIPKNLSKWYQFEFFFEEYQFEFKPGIAFDKIGENKYLTNIAIYMKIFFHCYNTNGIRCPFNRSNAFSTCITFWRKNSIRIIERQLETKMLES